MKVRFAALSTICAAALLWYTEPLKSQDLAATCVSSKTPRSDVIAACTALLNDPETTPEYQHLFLRERAWALSCNRKSKRAIADINRALELQPRNYKTMALSGKILAASGDHQKALASFDQAVALGPAVSYTYWNRARYLDRQGDDEKAFADYKRVLELNSNASNAAKHMAFYLFDQQEYEQALTVVKEAAEKWPDKAWVHGELAKIHIFYTENAAQALSSVAKMQELSPDSQVDIFGRALVHLQIGDEREGIRLVDVFVRDARSQRDSELDFLERLARHIWTDENEGLEREHRGRAAIYEYLGRRDLARIEYHNLFEKTGLNGENVMERVLVKNDLSTDVGANSKGSDRLNLLLDRYLDHNHDKLEWLSHSKRAR